MPGSVHVYENEFEPVAAVTNGATPGGTTLFPATESSRSRNAIGWPDTTALTVMDKGKTALTLGLRPGIAVKPEDDVEIGCVRQSTVWQLMAVFPPLPA